MGLATIINGFIVFGLPLLGERAIAIAAGPWAIEVGTALACGGVIPYMMFTRQEHSIDQMTGVWLLSVVAAEVAAASGGLLAPRLASSAAQLAVLTASYALWAYSVPVAFAILSILMPQIALHKLPHSSMATSSWFAFGPIGTGRWACWFWAATRRRSSPRMGSPPSAWSRKNSA